MDIVSHVTGGKTSAYSMRALKLRNFRRIHGQFTQWT